MEHEEYVKYIVKEMGTGWISDVTTNPRKDDHDHSVLTSVALAETLGLFGLC